jgi:hypothetical protein
VALRLAPSSTLLVHVPCSKWSRPVSRPQLSALEQHPPAGCTLRISAVWKCAVANRAWLKVSAATCIPRIDLTFQLDPLCREWAYINLVNEGRDAVPAVERRGSFMASVRRAESSHVNAAKRMCNHRPRRSDPCV